LLWDLSNLVAKQPAAIVLTENEKEQAWRDLDNADARKAWSAVWRLAHDSGVAFLKTRVTAVPLVSASKLDQLINDLGSPHFSVRDAAQKELTDLDMQALPALKKTLLEKPPLETRRRIEKLLTVQDTGVRTPTHLLRAGRSVAVLERVGTAEARAILRTLSEGAVEARLTQAAQAALARLRQSQLPPK
jgi:hypothetical protein